MLKLEGISKKFNDRQVLSDLNLTIELATVYGLLGPNGAGKTTAINIICNLLKPDRGLVLFNDRPITNQTKALIGVAPQQNLLYQTLTCGENLRFFGKIYGISGKKIKPKGRRMPGIGGIDRSGQQPC